MLLANYIDIIGKVGAALDNFEQEYLFDLLETRDDGYVMRREEGYSEKRFWNQFWRKKTSFFNNEAARQAFKDMAEDKDFYSLQHNYNPSAGNYRNFESAVAFDQHIFFTYINLMLNRKAPDAYLQAFYNLQVLVQDNFDYNELPTMLVDKGIIKPNKILTLEAKVAASVAAQINAAIKKTHEAMQSSEQKVRRKKKKKKRNGLKPR